MNQKEAELEKVLLELCDRYAPLTIVRGLAAVMCHTYKSSTYGHYKKFQDILESTYEKMLRVYGA